MKYIDIIKNTKDKYKASLEPRIKEALEKYETLLVEYNINNKIINDSNLKLNKFKKEIDKLKLDLNTKDKEFNEYRESIITSIIDVTQKLYEVYNTISINNSKLIKS